MPEFHDEFRGTKELVPARRWRPTRRWPSCRRTTRGCASTPISTATDENLDEIKQLTDVPVRPLSAMDHHNLAIIRGDRKNPTLQGPSCRNTTRLYEYVRRLWAPRERGRYGGIVEPMLQWTKVEERRQQTQVVPCRAGVLSAVVYANGDVSRVRDARAARQPAPAVASGTSGLAPEAKHSRARSAPRSATARTKSSCGRASSSSRRSSPSR